MKKELFEELLESVKQGAAIMKGRMKPLRSIEFPESEVRKIREKYGLSQDKFASLMGISVATLRNWEQGRRKPEGPAPGRYRGGSDPHYTLFGITTRPKM